jgi:hypothetical protein
MTDPTVRAASIQPGQPGRMPFTVLLDEAMRRTRRHIRAIFPAVAIPLALLSAAVGVLQALWFQDMKSEGGLSSLGGSPFLSLPTVLLGLAHSIVLGIGMVALQKAAADATAGRPVDMKEAWRFAVRGPVLVTLFLQGLAVIAALLVCCVPIFYVAPLLSLVSVVMAEEKIFGTAALSRSAALTRYDPDGRFFETALFKAFALMLVTVVISYAVAFLVVLPFQVPMFISMFRDAAAGKDPAVAMGTMSKWLWIQIPSQILQTLTTVAVFLYGAFGYALLFFDARSRKEGSDLAAEIHTVFGSGGPSGAPPV